MRTQNRYRGRGWLAGYALLVFICQKACTTGAHDASNLTGNVVICERKTVRKNLDGRVNSSARREIFFFILLGISGIRVPRCLSVLIHSHHQPQCRPGDGKNLKLFRVNRIMNEVCGINRVVCDISSKPPATVEWE
jgi:hypothetical protein